MDFRIQNEIEHGKYLSNLGAEDVWNWNSPAGTKRKQRRIFLITQRLNNKMCVLEIGCGTGHFTPEFAKAVKRLVAVDISPELLDQAKANNSADNIQYFVQNAYDMKDIKSSSFDAVVGTSILHHLDLHKTLLELHRVLKPEGSIIFSEPNMLNPQIAMERNVPFLRKIMHASPDETAFIRWRLSNDLKNNGFIDIKIEPFDFLHPSTPQAFIPFIEKVSTFSEKIPVLREIAGSLFITAKKGS